MTADAKNLKQPPIVLHISGPDRPGITSTLTKILADENAVLMDIGQSVLHGFLILSAIVDIPKSSDALRKLLFAVHGLGLKLEVGTLAEEPLRPEPSSEQESLCLTLIGKLQDGRAVAETTGYLAKKTMNIREIKALTEDNLQGLELIVDLNRGTHGASALAKLRGEILGLASTLKIDMAVQRDDIFRRNKRLVCMDVDSTFIQMEVIDELARVAGCKEKVAAITERAMQGQLDFKQALAERISLLKGLEFSKARELLANIPMSPGAEQLVKTLKRLGFKIGLVSGGFDFFVDALKEKFHLDFAFANHLEVVDSKITGKVLGTVVDAERKSQLLQDMCQAYHCPLEQSVAIGDGANDILMLQSAGLGIAFRAKARLQEAADLSLNQGSLDDILFLMGYRSGDIENLSK